MYLQLKLFLYKLFHYVAEVKVIVEERIVILAYISVSGDAYYRFFKNVIVFKYLRPYLPGALFWPMLLYLLINGGMNCFAWFRSMSTTGGAAALTALGALLFYISDTALFFVRFNNESRIRTHFPVMLTYSAGELLIILGLILN